MATINNRHVTALGPIKMEVLNLTDVDDAETVSTLIQNPKWAVGVVNTDAAAQTVALNVGISGKVLTINQASLSGAEVNVLVFGF